MKNSRKLKIHTKYRPGVYGNTTIPEIRLEGKWLEKLGFREGRMVYIAQAQDKLIITLYNERPPI